MSDMPSHRSAAQNTEAVGNVMKPKSNAEKNQQIRQERSEMYNLVEECKGARTSTLHEVTPIGVDPVTGNELSTIRVVPRIEQECTTKPVQKKDEWVPRGPRKVA